MPPNADSVTSKRDPSLMQAKVLWTVKESECLEGEIKALRLHARRHQSLSRIYLNFASFSAFFAISVLISRQ